MKKSLEGFIIFFFQIIYNYTFIFDYLKINLS